MAAKFCKANAGTRKEPRPCGQPVAKGMLWACSAHRTKLIPSGESGIYYRGGSYVVVTLNRGRQTKTFHPTIDLARDARGDRTGSNKQAPQERRPFDVYAREWVRNCQGRTRRGFDEDTRAAYERALELHAIPHFRSTPLRDIDRTSVNALVAKLQRQGLSAASIAKYIAPVRALFGDAVENGKLTANPALSLKINAKHAAGGADTDEPERIKEMTRAELAAVLAAIPERHRLAFEIMAQTGCRISEALGLEWGDLELRGDVTTLRIERQWYRGKLKRPKTAAGMRTIELGPGLARRLWDLGADAAGPILQTRSGSRQSGRNLARVLEAASKRANVPGVTHHSFRHTHGSILLDEGWTIAEVADRLGHADPSITAAVYSHRMRDRRRELGFLDGLGPVTPNERAAPNVGNGWAMEGPEIAANDRPAITAESLN